MSKALRVMIRLSCAMALILIAGLAFMLRVQAPTHGIALDTPAPNGTEEQPGLTEPAGTVEPIEPTAPPDPLELPGPEEPVELPQSVTRYLTDTPVLLDHGYSRWEVDMLFSNGEQVTAEFLLNQPYDPRTAEYVLQPHFRQDSLERYCAYGQANPDMDAAQVVTRVNIGLDRPFYSEPETVAEPGTVDVLVNKYHYLDGFKPELVQMDTQYASSSNMYMEPTAYEHFVELVDAARADGVKLRAVSVYRSYSTQKSLYWYYVGRRGQAAADTWSARPGFSEHQTGLAVDINTAKILDHFENTGEYRWLVSNSWKYGFILRYPEGMKGITGFVFEPWHYRYVGMELARTVHDSGLTYDEYVASLPSGDVKSAIGLTVDGEEKELTQAPLRLDGVYYLSADDLARALGMTLRRNEAGAVSLAASGCSLTFYPNHTRYLSDCTAQTMACAAFEQEEELMLPLADVAQALGLTLTETEQTICLNSVS